MKILAFAASNSENSINKKLVTYAANCLVEQEIDILDLGDFTLPIYSQTLEGKNGIPDNAHKFFNKVKESDALLISFAEHNGSYTACYKNLFDWASRIDTKFYHNKRSVFLATSPGQGGASRVLQSAIDSAVTFGANLQATFSLPNFYDNFDTNINSISDKNLDQDFKVAINKIL